MILHPSNSSPADTNWRFLIAFPLADFLSDRNRQCDLTAGFLYQALIKLDISPECLADIDRTLTDFAGEKWRNFQQGGHDYPGQVRFFCQRKSIGGLAALQPDPHDHTIQNALVFPGLNTKINGGWGFFLIARGGDVDLGPANLVDVYLYREGE
jgi:hypothetical protein